MNEDFEDLRSVSVRESDVDSVVAGARTAVLAGITRPQRASGAKAWSIGIGAGLVAAASGTAVVIANQQPHPAAEIAESATPTPTPIATPRETPAPTPTETSTPAPIPQAATLASVAEAVAAGGNDIPAGMYRKISTHSVMVLTGAMTDDGDVGHAPARPKTGAIRVEQDTFSWIPSDRFDVWVDSSDPSVLTGTYGPYGAILGEQYAVGEPGGRSEQAGGRFLADESMADWFAAAPRDPVALIAAERARYLYDGMSADALDIIVAEQLMMKVAECAAPVDLQATMVSALVSLGNVETVSATPTSLTLRVPGSESVSWVTLDATTGCATEKRTTFDEVGADLLPSDVFNGTVETFGYEIVASAD